MWKKIKNIIREKFEKITSTQTKIGAIGSLILINVFCIFVDMFKLPLFFEVLLWGGVVITGSVFLICMFRAIELENSTPKD